MNMNMVRTECKRPVGGRLRYFTQNWGKIFTDPWILETVSGCKLEFRSIPYQGGVPRQTQLDSEKSRRLSEEVLDLERKEAVSRVPDSRQGFTSSIFLVPKSDSSWRPVINPKPLNQNIITRHFKMESIRTVKGLMQREDWLVKLDLKDAYLSIPIFRPHQKYLKFRWQNQVWQFKTLPFGLSSAPYTFTKLLKPAVATLRRLAIRTVLYLDDMLLMARSKEEARMHLATALELLIALGFIVNTRKSIFSPTQELEFLGFLLNSCRMTISLPAHKLHSLRQMARRMAGQEKTTVRELAQMVGTMVATHPAILPAPLYYRHLERAKSLALRSGLPYEAEAEVDQSMKTDLLWWIRSSSHHNGRPLQITQWDLVIELDASKTGWGASCQGMNTGGPWTGQEKINHINFLELLAAFLALKSFASDKRAVSILLRLDNITAIAFLNRMGGSHSLLLSRLAIDIWSRSLERSIFIHAEHLPGKENVRAVEAHDRRQRLETVTDPCTAVVDQTHQP